jgi:cytochrome c biogenesis protein ResB
MDNFDVKVTRRTRYTIRFNIYNKEYILKDRGKIKRDIDLVKHVVVEALIGIVIGALLSFFLLYIYTSDIYIGETNSNINTSNNIYTDSNYDASTKYIYIDKEDHVAYITLSNIDKDIN